MQISFYEKHDPRKIEEVDSFLESYTSMQIVKTLIDKYSGMSA
jgi:hypothetical protein